MKRHYEDIAEVCVDMFELGLTEFRINSDENGYYVEYAKSCHTDDYQELAARTIRADLSREKALADAAMGLCGEAGEVCDHIKKHLFQGHELNCDKVTEELGDACWYIAFMCETLGVKLSEVMSGNIDKLKARYPEGFSEERSINREA